MKKLIILIIALCISWSTAYERVAVKTDNIQLMEFVNFKKQNANDFIIHDYAVDEQYEIYNKIKSVSKNLEIEPIWLVKAIKAESRWNPTIKNNIGAVGLIQFTKSTAKYLGTSTNEIASMPISKQLDLVEKYLSYYKSKLTTYFNVRLALLYPVGLHKPLNTVLFKYPEYGYLINAPLDSNYDGVLTIKDYMVYVNKT